MKKTTTTAATTTTTEITKLENAVIANAARECRYPLKPEAFDETGALTFGNWKSACEALGAHLYDMVAEDENGLTVDGKQITAEYMDARMNKAFTLYKVVLAFFTDKASGKKLHCGASDILALYKEASKWKWNADNSQMLKPTFARSFRKAIERRVARVLMGYRAMTAEEHANAEAEKREARKAKKSKKSTKGPTVKVDAEAEAKAARRERVAKEEAAAAKSENTAA